MWVGVWHIVFSSPTPTGKGGEKPHPDPRPRTQQPSHPFPDPRRIHTPVEPGPRTAKGGGRTPRTRVSAGEHTITHHISSVGPGERRPINHMSLYVSRTVQWSQAGERTAPLSGVSMLGMNAPGNGSTPTGGGPAREDPHSGQCQLWSVGSHPSPRATPRRSDG